MAGNEPVNWWLAQLASAGGTEVPADASLEFRLAGAPEGWGWIIFFAALSLIGAFVFLVYRREMDSCPPGMRLLLASLRFTALILLALVLLNPSLVVVQWKKLEPFVVLLRDASPSMATTDAFPNPADAEPTLRALGQSLEEYRARQTSRAGVINELLARRDGEWLNRLATRGKVRVIDFADTAQRAAEPGTPPGELAPAGRGTNLSSALDEALALSPAAAVIVLSDGQHTAAGDPVAVAYRALQAHVPLYTVGIGDASRPRNLSVASVYVRPQVWPDEPFEVKAVLAFAQLGRRSVQVSLREHSLAAAGAPAGEGTIVEQRSVDLPEGDGQVAVDFSRTLSKPGKFAFSVEVSALDDERNADDNARLSNPVAVLNKQRVRVLLIAGSPSWEYRLLEPLLERERTIALSCWLQSLDEQRAQSGSEPITRLPTTEAELFQYDVVLMLDPHPGEFDTRFLNLLQKFVSQHAGGVLYAAGPKYSAYLLTDSRTQVLRELLPVRFGDIGAIEVAALLSMNTREWPLRVLRSNVDHPLMMFTQDWQASLAHWEGLPGIYWSFPALKPDPAAKVLLEHSDPTLRRVEGARPLLVSGRYGSGHVVYLGFNGTWRWRRAGSEGEFFDRFWIQAVRYLAEGRSLKGQRRGSLQSDRERYEVGDKVSLTAELRDAAFQPVVLPEISGTLQVGESPAVAITFQPRAEQPGRYAATVAARKPGDYTVRVPLPPAPGEAAAAEVEASFRVELPSAELTNTSLNKPLLRQVAEASGGRYFELNEWEKIPEAVPDRTATSATPGRPNSLWDNWLVLAVSVGLLCLEWTIRKWHKLL